MITTEKEALQKEIESLKQRNDMLKKQLAIIILNNSDGRMRDLYMPDDLDKVDWRDLDIAVGYSSCSVVRGRFFPTVISSFSHLPLLPEPKEESNEPEVEMYAPTLDDLKKAIRMARKFRKVPCTDNNGNKAFNYEPISEEEIIYKIKNSMI